MLAVLFLVKNNSTEITQHKGGSVLLPCSCSDLLCKPQTFTWETFRTGHLTEVLNDEHYRGRYQLFNNISPANLSLLISDLREEDEGDYKCSTEKEHRDTWLYVKDLTEEDQGFYRCSAQADHRDLRLSVEGGRCGENVVAGGHQDCEGKQEDQEEDVERMWLLEDIRTVRESRRIRLSVLNSHHDQGGSVIMKCLYILSVVFHMAAGCELVKKTVVEEVTGFIGESVVLPCVCTDLQDDPKRVTWRFHKNNHFQEIYSKQTGNHSNRVKLVSKNPPGNLSLLISDLTEEDQGIYTCSVQDDHRDLRLSVKVFVIVAGLLLVISGVVAFICWRRKGIRSGQVGRSGENMMTEGRRDRKGNLKDQIVPDVTYSTVSHVNTAGAARVQIIDGEETEYASIITQ
ncbi:hypothetical protein C0J50_3414 [Silurus asotus]|uniref:Ig-like domain-containing protein n=1 Tax=Silurus asotus TaxID=30991 RepID=A0AAD5AEB7_SILAS|nr:hypothetical protein C0J50_3414 [Silurus asotus]